jgi:CheY-like chemotaxis protein
MHGTWNDLSATVVRCQYVEGGVHEIGVKFDRAVDPSAYCAAAIRARVLLVEDEPMLAKLGTLYLQQLNADVQTAANGREALAKIESGVFDLILMDIEMPEMNGWEAVTELRKRGYIGAITAATALTGPNDRERCLSSGFDHYLPKPYKREDLAKLINTLREEPLFSSLEGDSAMDDLINVFVSELPARIRTLETATASGDLAALTAQVRSLKAQAGSHGFEPISETARQIEARLLANKSLADILGDMKFLMKLCSQVRPVAKTTEQVVVSAAATDEPEKAPADSSEPQEPS